DIVLFEGVIPEGQGMDALTQEDGQDNALRDLQAKLGAFLGLEFQLDHIAYGRPHFVHADLTMEQMNGMLSADGEDRDVQEVVGGGLPDMAALMKIARPILDILTAVGDAIPALRTRMKRSMAGALATQAVSPSGMVPADLYDLLIVQRNAVVLARLAEIPPDARTVAVFYGAAHLEDLERRMTEQMGYERAGARWMTAWDMPSRRRR
ncbi:MAG: hypothetical protein ACYTG6_11280, partial [Planctomycetota bacterium]